MKMNTKKLGTLALLAVFVLVFASAGPAKAETTIGSDKFAQSLEQSLKHYVMALEAYNDGNYGKVKGQLQAAASNAKHADPHLADLLSQLYDCFPTQWSSVNFVTLSQIAIIYNTYNGQYGWNLPNFDPGNPTGVPPGEGVTSTPGHKYVD